MNALRRLLVAIGLTSLLGGAGKEIVADVTEAAENGASALNALGYRADFSFKSIRELERFMSDNVNEEGGARPNGELVDQAGAKLFLAGSYLGEVLRRHLNGRWEANKADPASIFDAAVVLPDGTRIWPIQRMVKRFQNGYEDNVWHYASLIAKIE